MRRFFLLLYLFMAGFVNLLATGVFVTLGVATAQSSTVRWGWFAFGVLSVVNLVVLVHYELHGRMLIAWWPMLYRREFVPLWLKLLIVLPLFTLICYLLLYAALVQINGVRPEWLEP